MSLRVGLAVFAAFLLGIYVLFQIATRPPEPPGHQVIYNGHVLTMDDTNQIAEAVSIRGDRIEAVGSSEAMLAVAEDDTVVTDLRGRTLMPGIVDAHGHFPGSGQVVFSADLNSPPIGSIESIPGLIAELKTMAERRTDGWILGWGYDDTLLAENRHPTREDLDKVSTTRPVAITHISGHLVAVNSLALAELDISASTPDPEGGIIQRDPGSPDGMRPNGVLEETAGRLVIKKSFDLGIGDAVRVTTHAARTYLEQGVTTASAGGMPAALAKALGPMSRLNLFPQRVALFPLLEDVEAKVLDEGWRPESLASGRVSVPRVKIVADGSIQGYTAYLSQPYHTSFQGDPGYRGYPSVSREDLFRQLEKLYEQRVQVAIHCNGDAAIEDALDAIAAAAEAHSWDQARPLIIHAQMARLDQIERMAELGVTPSFFSAHTFYWGDRHIELFMGPERAANMSPARWAMEAGIRFSSHMDTPVVPMLPMQSVWSQIERRSTSGGVIGAYQRIPAMQALRAVTIDAAWQVFMDDDVGSIEAGKLADLIILSGDPLTAADVRELVVEKTLIGGAEVFSRI